MEITGIYYGNKISTQKLLDTFSMDGVEEYKRLNQDNLAVKLPRIVSTLDSRSIQAIYETFRRFGIQALVCKAYSKDYIISMCTVKEHEYVYIKQGDMNLFVWDNNEVFEAFSKQKYDLFVDGWKREFNGDGSLDVMVCCLSDEMYDLFHCKELEDDDSLVFTDIKE